MCLIRHSVGDWDVGFIFRDSGDGNLQYVAVTNDGRYSHRIRVDGENALLSSGVITNWSDDADSENKLSLIVIEDRGWLVVNSQFVADLDVSGGIDDGALQLATGIFAGDEVEGESTRVRDIVASEIGVLYGPESGSLTKEASQIAVWRAGLDVSWGYASAEFRVPDDVGRWSGGFLFRKRDQDDYLVFRVQSNGAWLVSHATLSGDGWQSLEVGYSGHIDVDDPILNRVEVFFIGHVAMLYVNWTIPRHCRYSVRVDIWRRYVWIRLLPR